MNQKILKKKKTLFQKFQLIPILRSQITCMCDYVVSLLHKLLCWILILVFDDDLCENCSHITLKWFSLILLGKCAS